MSKFSPGFISLVDYQQEDEPLWSIWQSKVDLEKYQTYTRPKNFQERTGVAAGSYILKVITFNEQKIGAIWLEEFSDGPPRSAELGLFIAEKPLWNQGLGTASVQQMITMAKGLGLERVWLNVRDNNVRAILCYKKCGFIMKQKFPPRRFEDGSYQGWYLMEKAIT